MTLYCHFTWLMAFNINFTEHTHTMQIKAGTLQNINFTEQKLYKTETLQLQCYSTNRSHNRKSHSQCRTRVTRA